MAQSARSGVEMAHWTNAIIWRAVNVHNNEMTGFSPKVVEHLGYYVYRLEDPETKRTFYVGKGTGNRVFNHAKNALGTSDNDGILDLKTEEIRRIIDSGRQVSHIIHRHGMSEDVAYEVEAALIDSFDSLTNKVGGHGSNDRGPMSAATIERRYAAPEAHFYHAAVLININRSHSADAATSFDLSHKTGSNIYAAARFAWKISIKRASKCELVLAVSDGIIVGVFKPTKWLWATKENFPEFEPMPKRKGFIGTDAPPEIRAMYENKRVPDIYRKRGAANPIKYVTLGPSQCG